MGEGNFTRSCYHGSSRSLALCSRCRRFRHGHVTSHCRSRDMILCHDSRVYRIGRLNDFWRIEIRTMSLRVLVRQILP